MWLEWLRTQLEARSLARAPTPCAAAEIDLAAFARGAWATGELAAEIHDYPCPAA